MANKNAERFVYHRDASFFNHPGCATQYHYPRGAESIALCNRRILLDESNACSDVDAGSLLCKRCARMAE